MLTLPKYLRSELKKPLGQLYKSIDIIEEKLHQQLSEDKLIISIGDATTKNLIKLNIQPQICIVDNKIERSIVSANSSIKFSLTLLNENLLFSSTLSTIPTIE